MNNPITESPAAVAYAPDATTPRPRLKRRNQLTLPTIAARLAGRGIELISEYRGVSLPARFKAQCGHEWSASAGTVINGKSKCPVCVRQLHAERARAAYAASRKENIPQCQNQSD